MIDYFHYVHISLCPYFHYVHIFIILLTGIMEAIKIRKSGFSLRITFADFVDRYAILVGIGKPKTKETCTEIVGHFRKFEK